MSNELDFAYELSKSAIIAPDHYHTVITLACAATHKIDDLDSAARILALGLKGSGKSTLLKVARYLAANTTAPTGVLAMTAPSYVADFRLNPHCTHLIDEISQLFGTMGSNGGHSKFYTYLNQGYTRDTAWAQMQENKAPLQIPIFGFVFMAGLGLACPEDLRDRSIILRMEKAPKKAEVADFSDPQTKAAFQYGGKMLKSWAQRIGKLDPSSIKGIHPELTHRNAEVWGALFQMAQAAGGVWPDRILLAFERLALGAGVPVYAPEDQILADWLTFSAQYDVNDGVPSGQFAAYAYEQDHGAFLGMKPGQFKQFAVSILGPTAPFYDHDAGKMIRGWAGPVKVMNTENAQSRMIELEAQTEDESETVVWDDF